MKSLTPEIRAELEAVIGNIQQVTLLHKRWIRRRESYRPVSKRSPKVYLLSSESGVRYKLLIGNEGGSRISRIRHYSEQCAGFSFFPELASSGDDWLLIEYIEGSEPDFSSKGFAYDIGISLAQMHLLNRRPCDASKIQEHLRKDIHQLQKYGHLTTNKDVALVWNVFERLNLGVCPTSLDYFDVKPSNFIRATNGQIYFVDLGAIGENWPTGQFLFGSLHYDKLKMRSFAEGYLSGGGDQAILDRGLPFRVLHCLWLAAHYYRRAAEIPFYVAPMKYGFQIMGRRLINKSLHLASDCM